MTCGIERWANTIRVRRNRWRGQTYPKDLVTANAADLLKCPVNTRLSISVLVRLRNRDTSAVIERKLPGIISSQWRYSSLKLYLCCCWWIFTVNSILGFFFFFRMVLDHHQIPQLYTHFWRPKYGTHPKSLHMIRKHRADCLRMQQRELFLLPLKLILKRTLMTWSKVCIDY